MASKKETEGNDETKGLVKTIKPLSAVFFNNNEQSLRKTLTKIALVDTKSSSKTPIEMEISTERNDEGTELTMRLTIVGNNAASAGYPLMLYAQLEDPDRPGVYESFSCTVVLDKQDYFVQDRNLFLMNYHGPAKMLDETRSAGNVKFL